MKVAELAHPAEIYFDEVEIPPHESVVVYARIDPRLALFRGENIIESSSPPQSTSILHVLVGSRLQILGGIKMDTWQRGLHFTISIKNTTDVPVKWSAKIVGKGIDLEEEVSK